METYKKELYHDGILGMKWGHRNGPPYPLKKHSAAEIKAGAKKTALDMAKTSRSVAASTAKTSRSAAVSTASNKITKAIVNKLDKNGNQKIDGKEIVSAALKTAGTVAISTLVTKGINKGIDSTISVGKVATSKLIAKAAEVKVDAVSNLAVNAALAIARKKK